MARQEERRVLVNARNEKERKSGAAGMWDCGAAVYMGVPCELTIASNVRSQH
jgi:hypothetical protein